MIGTPRQQIVLMCLGWLLVHVLLAALLDVRLWASSRPSSQLPTTLGFWVTLALVVQLPFLLARSGNWPL
jgi:hypothetical protein